MLDGGVGVASAVLALWITTIFWLCADVFTGVCQPQHALKQAQSPSCAPASQLIGCQTLVCGLKARQGIDVDTAAMRLAEL